MNEGAAYLKQLYDARGFVLDAHKVLVAEDLPFMKALNGVASMAYTGQRRLDRKTKELMVIAALTAMGAAQDHIRTHIEVARREGMTKEEMLEAIELLLVPCGLQRFSIAFGAFAEAFPVRREELDSAG